MNRYTLYAVDDVEGLYRNTRQAALAAYRAGYDEFDIWAGKLDEDGDFLASHVIEHHEPLAVADGWHEDTPNLWDTCPAEYLTERG